MLQTLHRGPMHGYALAQIIKRDSGDLLEIEEGSLYPSLAGDAQGWLAGRGMGLVGAQRRVPVYKITPVGRKQLEHKVSSFDRMLEGIVRVIRPVQS